MLGKRFHPQRVRRTLGAASRVRERARFVVNELRDLPVVGEYRLRDADLLARVRHPLLDMWVFEEIFRFRVYDPPMPVARRLDALPDPVRVVDLGGHVGLFGLFIRSIFPDAVVTSLEPDPGNAAELARCIEANALHDRWTLIEACAATSDGTVDFASNFHLSRAGPGGDGALEQFHAELGGVFPFLRDTNLLQADHRQVESRDVFPLLADADLVKMDIEGSEWEILADPRWSELQATAVVLEYHDMYTGAADAAQATAEALERAGYQTGPPQSSGPAGTMWAWKDAAQRRTS